jgi:hypothetical protein
MHATASSGLSGDRQLRCLPRVIGLLILSAAFVRAETNLPPAASPVPPPSSPPRFLVPATVVRLGGSQVIPFRLAHPAAARTVYPVKVEPADRLEILQPPTVLAGESLGYLRIRPLALGAATLHVEGQDLRLSIVPGERPAPPPEITTPVAGSEVWGKIAVGAELFSTRAAADARTVVLRLPDGTELAAESRPGPRDGSHLRFAFTVDADRLPPGRNLLTPVVHQAGQPDLAGRPVAIETLRPAAATLVAGACAEHLDGPRPQKDGDKPPRTVKDPQAANGLCVAGGEPWCLPVEVPTPGYYQMIVTARGEFGGGALPTVAVHVNEERNAFSAARLAGTGWQRVPVGAPFRLPAGAQIIAVSFANHFSFGKGDERRLFLDRYELARVGGERAGAGGGGGERMMASMMGAEPAMAQTAQADAAMEAPGGARNPQGRDDIDPEVVSPDISGPGEALRVAFDRVLDGRPVDGLVTLHARCWWPHPERGGAVPRTELLVNGAARGAQQGGDLFFRLAPGALYPGANTLALRATLPGGVTVEGPPQRIFMDAAQPGPARRFLRFTALDAGWGASLAARLEAPQHDRFDRDAVFTAPGEAALALPAELEGNYALVLEGNGKGLRAVIRTDRGDQAPGPGGAVKLARGAKQLVLVRGDEAKAEKYALHAVRLDEAAPSTPAAVPQVAVLYPASGGLLGPADAVVVRPFSASGIDWVDCSIDGQPLGLRLKPEDGLGRIVFPLVTRDLAPGTHHLQVFIHAANGQTGVAREVDFETEAPEEGNAAAGPYARAIRLLDRFAYGPDPDALAAILVDGEEVWLKGRLGEPADSPAEEAVGQRVGVVFPMEGGGAPVRALQQLLLTANPVRARFVLWAENHFSTWVEKVRNTPKWREHERFWDLGAAPFGDLLLTSATSPAMLVYLDQFHSYAGKLNENYAREIMELHTLGVHGGYTQADVTTLAGLLNGWTLSDEADLDAAPEPEPFRVFRFDPLLNDGKERRVLGMEFPPAAPAERFDRVLAALELLAAHPSTADFVCRKVAEQYVGVPAPQPLVDRLAGVYLSTGGDMRAILLALADSPEFLASDATPRMMTPLDYGLRLARLAAYENPYRIVDFLKQSGAGLFDRATPDGYPENDGEYASSNALLQRWRLARDLGTRFNRLMPADWQRPDYDWSDAHRRAAIDYTALRVTGRLLSPASAAAADEVMRKTAAVGPDKTALLAAFICQLPEAELR